MLALKAPHLSAEGHLPSFISQLSWPRAFYGLATLGLALGLLYWLRPVLVPIALAILLTFLLSPVVRVLERRRLNRAIAVAVVVLLAVSFFAGVGWVVGRQASALVEAVPQYEENLTRKLSVLRTNSAGLLDRIRFFARKVNNPIAPPEGQGQSGNAGASREPPLVRVQPEEPHLTLSEIVGSLAMSVEPLARATLVVMLVVFMLLWREDLRDRLIGAVGHGRITATTKALDEAGQRIASYLLTQLAVNAAYGLALGIGLLVIGIPYAVLWGILAALLRYAPYVGATLGALFPIVFSILTMDGWHAPVLAAAWFVIIEFSANFLIEPWIYGRRIGISPTAALIMVAFWTWLWGPVGLILAYPLTVCLVVLGQFVPYLKFLDTLLGDQPVLDDRSRFYQRLLARDVDEASRVAEQFLREHSLVQTYDTLLLPALASASMAANEDALSEEDRNALIHDCRGIMDLLAASRDLSSPEMPQREQVDVARAFEPRRPVMVFAARDGADELATAMLATLLDPARYNLELFGSNVLAAEALAAIEKENPTFVCIISLGPGGVALTAVLCRRLRKRFPDLQVAVGRWGVDEHTEAVQRELLADGACVVVNSLEEMYAHVVAMHGARPAPRDAELLPASGDSAASGTAGLETSASH